jgi:hypothetical protein
VDVELGGVDDLVGQVAEVGEQLALPGDTGGYALVGGQRVPATRLGVAPDQALVRGIEEDQLDVVSLVPETTEDARGLPEHVPLAGIDHQREASVGLGHLAEAGELRQEHHRKVVDAEVASVLQGPDRGGLPRPRDAGEDDDAPAAVRRDIHHSTSSPRVLRMAPSAMARLSCSANSLALWCPCSLRR